MGRPTKYTHDNDDEIARRYQEDAMSLRALSLEYSIPVMTIKRRLIKRGIEIRNISTAMTLFHKNRKPESNTNGADSNFNRVTGVVQFDDQPEAEKAEEGDDTWIS
jgi:hypothetical protein